MLDLQEATKAVSQTVLGPNAAVSWLPSVSPTGIALASSLSMPAPVVAEPPAAGTPPVRQAPDAAPVAQEPSSDSSGGGSGGSGGSGGGSGGSYYPPATPSGKTITARFSFTK